jgi:hypothetical protein
MVTVGMNRLLMFVLEGFVDAWIFFVGGACRFAWADRVPERASMPGVRD